MKYLLFVFSIVLGSPLLAQDTRLTSGQQLLQGLTNKATKRSGSNNPVPVGFVSSNIRYRYDTAVETGLQSSLSLTAWKGEKVHAQVAVQGVKEVAAVSVAVDDLRSEKGSRIPKANITAGFAGYVMTDEYGKGCDKRKPQDYASSLVADPIYPSAKPVALKKGRVQPVWISIRVPANTRAGVYTGKVTVKAGKAYVLDLSIRVLDRALPAPSQWSFHLDLWQHPAAIARVHKVPLWSDRHFALMKNYYTLLAGAGQKHITASIVNEPWGHQTYDDFPALVKWTKKKDGNWQYDYSLFDKYISFVMSCGINRRINCYSMVPWKIAFAYYDESLGKDTVFTGGIGTPEYHAFWKPMLTDFTGHLKKKGWFGITAIAMDERPMPAMQAVISLLKEVDKDWKIALAGDYHPEIEQDVYDYCISSSRQFPPSILQQRQQQGKTSTWYTSCSENYPNSFTFSPPAEQVWIGWYTAAKGMDGYLRWAYNSWPENPLHDSRFTSWPAGDTYQVYPGPLTSIRFEKLMEGIQDFEKIRILKKEYKQQGNEKGLRELNAALAAFDMKALEKQSAGQMVLKAKELLNR